MRTGLLPWMLLLALVGCSSVVRMQPDPRIPAAVGTLKIKSGGNDNSVIHLKVHHLAEPSRVRPGASAYVVWVAGGEPNAAAQNVGALQVDRNLSGSLRTVTPFRSFTIFLTAESSPTAQAPTDQPFMLTTFSRR